MQLQPTNNPQLPTPKPFLKWAGGKRQLMPKLIERAGLALPFARYHEPFLGGGALFFELAGSPLLSAQPSSVADVNPNLVDAYLGVRDHLPEVIALLEQHAARHGKEHYYEVRANIPAGLAERAARFIYLNKTCYNGLYRENKRGLFNVPIGDRKSPNICDLPTLTAASAALRSAEVTCAPFEAILDRAETDDFVYLDPPYDPVPGKASFTSYASGPFGTDEQVKLRQVFGELTNRGVKTLLSNSKTGFIMDLYSSFHIDTVAARRAINSKGSGRGAVEEVMVRNF